MNGAGVGCCGSIIGGVGGVKVVVMSGGDVCGGVVLTVMMVSEGNGWKEGTVVGRYERLMLY